MKWFALRLIMSLGSLTFLLATAASAQILVQGVVKPEEAPAPKADEVPIVVTQSSQPWSLRLAAGEVVDRAEGGGPELDGVLGRSWEGRRGTVKFTSSATEFFGQSTRANQFVYGVGVNASYKVSPRFLWSVGDTVTSSYARDTTALSASGLLPPNLLTHLNTASTDLRYDLSHTTQVRWALSDQVASFDSSTFAGGSTLSTHVNVARQLSRSQTLGVAGDYQRSVIDGTLSTIQGLLGTWQRVFGETLTVTGSAGMHWYTVPGQIGFQSAPGGSIGFTKRLSHNDSLSLRFDRSFETALGVGTHLTEGFSGSYGISLGSRLSLSLTGDYDTGTYPFDPNHKLIGRTLNAAVRYTMAHNLAFAVASGLYLRTDLPNPAVTTIYRTTMGLTYGRT